MGTAAQTLFTGTQEVILRYSAHRRQGEISAANFEKGLDNGFCLELPTFLLRDFNLAHFHGFNCRLVRLWRNACAAARVNPQRILRKIRL